MTVNDDATHADTENACALVEAVLLWAGWGPNSRKWSARDELAAGRRIGRRRVTSGGPNSWRNAAISGALRELRPLTPRPPESAVAHLAFLTRVASCLANPSETPSTLARR